MELHLATGKTHNKCKFLIYETNFTNLVLTYFTSEDLNARVRSKRCMCLSLLRIRKLRPPITNMH